jgi:Cd2+/Zn2+-exporting ATPase
MALSLAVFLVPPLLLGGGWAAWFYQALVLLVIACPCALVISTPVSIVAGLTGAARRGVLIKGGIHLETPARITAIAMDKTGTLTLGRPKVVELVPLGGRSEIELLGVAAAIEARSEHPIAHAILNAAADRGVDVVPAQLVTALPGQGVVGAIDGREVWVGSPGYLEERLGGPGDDELAAQLRRIAGAGLTGILVGEAQSVIGLIAVGDAVRPEARQIVAQLHKLGIAQVVMLTGDARAPAQAIAHETGIDEVHPELLPEQKVEAIERLVAQHRLVAMVGDGVNDAPAMARASLGIAMGAIGSDAAIETADIALMQDDLSQLPWLIRHSRATLTVIRQNIGFSLAVKLVFGGLTLFGMASLWGAIAADVGASLLVVLNGLRLIDRDQPAR